ncbi:MAG: fibrillarin-like rRNA/tRNA 2'-O-methyltransferase [Candidatus ainarchaeum sp.]|nr:fibrillarin-like rRNA/tRNA 2'-O-methyltransferase [Candidatus ainarchaeum sp.]
MEKKFNEIYSKGRNLYTHAFIDGRVYGEKLITENGINYREWNPFKSKYCAGLTNGLKENIFFKGATVLYLGSAEGTTVSHVSDIVGEEGNIFCVDLSEIAMQKLVKLSEKRENILPILSDAGIVDNYKEYLEDGVDALFQDVSQKDQTEIFLKNAVFLKKNCLGALSLKTLSISQSEKKEKILENEKKKLESVFEILQIVNLEPFETGHYLILVKKR